MKAKFMVFAVALSSIIGSVCSQADTVLIGPGIQNGSFEYVDGAVGSTAKVRVWDGHANGEVDDWTIWASMAGSATNDSGTEAAGYATDGSRAGFMETGNAVYNLTTNTIAAGDAFKIQWDSNGSTDYQVWLVYDNGGTIEAIADSEFAGANGTDLGGVYVVPAGSDAIGHPVGIGIFTGTGWSQLDHFRLSLFDVDIVSVFPEAGSTGVTNQPLLEVVLLDGTSQVDPGSIVLSLDGVEVPSSVLSAAPTTTVSYAVATPFDPGTWHTGKVVVAGMNPVSASITNEWVFKIEGSGSIGDYIAIDDFEDYASGAVRDVADPPWTADTSFARIEADGEGQFLAAGWDGGPRGGWRSVTNINDGAAGTYYFQIRSTDSTPYCYWGLSDVAPTGQDQEDLMGGAQIRFANSTNGFALAAMDGTNETILATGLQTANWYGIWLVIDNGADTFDVYYNDIGASRSGGSPLDIGSATLVGTDLGFRKGATADPLTTFVVSGISGQADFSQLTDNLYYTPSGSGPGLNKPVIQSFGISGDTVTLTWTSQAIGTYRILRKTSLTSGGWEPVKSGISGGSPTTTDSVTASGADQEFYSVDGE